MFPPFHFCGFQRPVILSHQPHLVAEKTPTKLYTPPPRPTEAPSGPARACTCQALWFAAARLLVSSPAADSPSILPLLLPHLVETRRSWLPRSEAALVGSVWHTCGPPCMCVCLGDMPHGPLRVKTLISTWPKIHPSFILSVREDQPERHPLQAKINKRGDPWLVV